MGVRRRGRELALHTLYALEFGHRTLDEALADMAERAREQPSDDEDPDLAAVRSSPDAVAFASKLVRGVAAHKDAIDQVLSQCSTNWKVARMAMVDRNILRMATFELRYLSDIPPKVTLNEAIEVAKRYGSQDSSAFINGLLDRIASLSPAVPGS